MSRDCDAIGCKVPTTTGKFMCLRHWRMVPIELQRTINDRYRALRKDFGFLSDVAYLDACMTAIDRIAAAESQQGVNPYQRHLVVAQRRAGARQEHSGDRVDCGECPNITSGCAAGHCMLREKK
jgi:hypothetical protein